MSQSFTYTGSEPVRLNKWMAELGLCSRREAEALIARGEVIVGGEKVAEPGHKISPGEKMTIASTAVAALDAQFTAVIHKPMGMVSAQPEGDQVPAARLVVKANMQGEGDVPERNASLAPLGRLDQDSRGLLLLSEDGVLAKAVIGPESGLDKEYLVTVKGVVTEEKLRLLRHGLELDGRRLRPARVTRTEGMVLRFVLWEGRKRQIRRMCELVELDVVDLLRVRIGPLSISGLPEGKWRNLTTEERTALIKASKTITPVRMGGTLPPMKKGRPKPPSERADRGDRASGPRPARDGARDGDRKPFSKGPRREGGDAKPFSKGPRRDGAEGGARRGYSGGKPERPNSPRKTSDGRPGRSGKSGGSKPPRSKGPSRD